MSAVLFRPDEPAAKKRPLSALRREVQSEKDTPASRNVKASVGFSKGGDRATSTGSTASAASAERAAAAAVGGHHPRGSTSSGSSHARPVSAMARTKSSSQALDDAKALIREIFDLCDDLGMSQDYVGALQRNISAAKSNDTAILRKIRDSLTEHKRATLIVLRRIEARERVLSCMSQFVEEVVGFHANSDGSTSNPRDASRRVAELAAPVVAEGDAILESLAQCTESVSVALGEWESTSTRLWAQDLVPPTSTSFAVSSFDDAMRDVPSRANRFQFSPGQGELRRFRWKGEDYSDKMKIDASFLGKVREVWASRDSGQQQQHSLNSSMSTPISASIHGSALSFTGALTTLEQRQASAATKIQSCWRSYAARITAQLHAMKYDAARVLQKAWRTRKFRGNTTSLLTNVDVKGRAALRLQSLWRGYSTRLRFHRALMLHRNATAIQRWFRFLRCHYAMRDRKHDREERKDAALTIERFLVRAIWQKRARQHSMMRQAAIVIQRFVRSRNAKKKQRVAREASRLLAVVPASVDLIQEEAEEEPEGAEEVAMEPPKVYFPLRTVQVEDFVLDCRVDSNINKINSSDVPHPADVNESSTQPTSSSSSRAPSIPFPVNCRRVWVEKPVPSDTVKKLFFDSSDVRVLGIGWAGEVHAAIKIQRGFRRFLRRRVAENADEDDPLAIPSACLFATVSSMYSSASDVRRSAAVVVQRFIDAKLSAQLVDARRPKANMAGVKVQRWWRCIARHLRRSASRHHHLAEDECCVFVAPSGTSADVARRRKAAAVKLSTFFLKLYRRWKKRDAAARRIARAFRLFRVQRTYCGRKRERRLQAIKDKEFQQEQLILHTAVRRRQAALTIYYYWLRYRAQKVVTALETHSKEVRGHEELQPIDKNVQAREATVIQSFWRASVARMETARARQAAQKTGVLAKQRERLVASAVTIQSTFRSCWARRELAVRREQVRRNTHVAALRIQKAVRRWLASNEAWQLRVSQLSMFKELQRMRKVATARHASLQLAAKLSA